MKLFYKTKPVFFFFLFFYASVCLPQKRNTVVLVNPTVKEVVDEINQDSVKNIIQTLQNFGTRYLANSNRRQVYKWIMNKFFSYGFTDVSIDSFTCVSYGTMTTTQYNVVAKIRGSVSPDEYYIIGGHYDSYSRTDVGNAPGADDNASGTASVLESARVIKKKNYAPSSTLVFIAFAAEELMLYGDCGSRHYATSAKTSGMNIKLMINNDMIANSTSYPSKSYVKVNYYGGAIEARDYAMNVTQEYSNLEAVAGTMAQNSDSAPFANEGFTAVYFEEHVMNTGFYHSPFDLVSNYNIPYCTEVIKAACATLLGYSGTVVPVSEKEKLPDNYALYQNYPNPFNPVTTLKYSIPKSQYVTLKVFDMLGREVQTLVNEEKSAGTHQVQFDGVNLSSGTYIYMLKTGLYSEARKFILLK